MLICLPASITYYYSERKFTGWCFLLFPPSLQLSHFRIKLAAVTAPPKRKGGRRHPGASPFYINLSYWSYVHLLWRFPIHGGTPKLLKFFGDFPSKKQSNIGVPPWLWTAPKNQLWGWVKSYWLIPYFGKCWTMIMQLWSESITSIFVNTY